MWACGWALTQEPGAERATVGGSGVRLAEPAWRTLSDYHEQIHGPLIPGKMRARLKPPQDLASWPCPKPQTTGLRGAETLLTCLRGFTQRL